MNKVLVYGRIVKNEDKPYVQQLIAFLHEMQFEVLVYLPYLDELKKASLDTGFRGVATYDALKNESIELVITLGGDGTILNAMTLIQDLDLPILGINLGRLGFLANAEKSKIQQSLLKIKNGNFDIEERTMLSLKSSADIFTTCPFALNDFTIHKRDNSAMILIHCYIDGALLNSYWADGLIISTPTGSTGYSLSCGGPIITPDCGNFVIAPVAPHNLNARPVVVSDQSEIKIEVEGRAESFLVTLDSRNDKVALGDTIHLTRCSFSAKLVRLDNTSFLKTIHQKLMWGLDKRN